MAERHPQLLDDHIAFIQRQHLFFVATAGAEGSINLSPKGMDSLRVLSPRRVAWLNLTGSGNETATHLRENSRMTLMLCSFNKQPLILRLYGEARTVYPRDDDWQELAALFPDFTGARQIFDVQLSLVQTSCGYAVPHYSFDSERKTLDKWALNKGRDGVEAYWSEKNQTSLDGLPTGILGGGEEP